MEMDPPYRLLYTHVIVAHSGAAIISRKYIKRRRGNMNIRLRNVSTRGEPSPPRRPEIVVEQRKKISSCHGNSNKGEKDGKANAQLIYYI
jgi:hypothetical protein